MRSASYLLNYVLTYKETIAFDGAISYQTEVFING